MLKIRSKDEKSTRDQRMTQDNENIDDPCMGWGIRALFYPA